MKKIAVVTGTSKRIGRSIVQKLLKEGYKVYGLCRTKPDFAESDFVWLAGDLTDQKDIAEMIGQISQKRIDLLVNNAEQAIIQDSLDFSREKYDQIFNLNV